MDSNMNTISIIFESLCVMEKCTKAETLEDIIDILKKNSLPVRQIILDAYKKDPKLDFVVTEIERIFYKDFEEIVFIDSAEGPILNESSY
jgi:hypothetical protein